MIKSTLVFYLFLGILLTSCKQTESGAEPLAHFYIGTYNEEGTAGIFSANLDANGNISSLEARATTRNPSYLAMNEDQTLLFAVNEYGDKSGEISCFSRASNDELTFLGTIPSGGYYPCYINIKGSVGYVANYGGSSSRFTFDKSGKMSEPETIRHQGRGPDSTRQEGPHAHGFFVHPDGNWGVTTDLGADKLYKYDLERWGDTTAVSVVPGAGPRHLTFLGKDKMYVINELNSTIEFFNLSNGQFKSEQHISTLPEKFSGENNTADIHIHPNGKFLYGSNRGHDSIVIFRIMEDGRLELVGFEKEDINWPRNFAIESTGRFLLVANKKGNSITVFEIDVETGELKKTGSQTGIPSPVCIKFIH